MIYRPAPDDAENFRSFEAEPDEMDDLLAEPVPDADETEAAVWRAMGVK